MSGRRIVQREGRKPLPMQPGLRAFMVVSEIPEGCRVWPVTDDRHAPHIRSGEFVVIDPADVEAIDLGELYLVEQSCGPVLWQVMAEPEPQRMSNPDRPCVWLRPLSGPRTQEEARDALMAGRTVYMSDGPIYLDALKPSLLGKVAAIYQPGRASA